jgi:hypothetical protein
MKRVVLMEMIKKQETKDDGRYIIFYEFNEDDGEVRKGKGWKKLDQSEKKGDEK